MLLSRIHDENSKYFIYWMLHQVRNFLKILNFLTNKSHLHAHSNNNMSIWAIDSIKFIMYTQNDFIVFLLKYSNFLHLRSRNEMKTKINCSIRCQNDTSIIPWFWRKIEKKERENTLIWSFSLSYISTILSIVASIQMKMSQFYERTTSFA